MTLTTFKNKPPYRGTYWSQPWTVIPCTRIVVDVVYRASDTNNVLCASPARSGTCCSPCCILMAS
jgi:hypothetical protein